jgi:hypothetical protein
MKVIVLDNPFVATLLEMFLGDKENPIGKFLAEAVKVDRGTAVPDAPDLKTNPDFYTKPDVPKYLVLKVHSNTDTAKMYDVTQDADGNMYCTCTGFKYRGKCSHITKVESYGNGMQGGIGLCINCRYFSRDERDINMRNRRACSNHNTILCPPLGGCRHFKYMARTAHPAVKKEMPMTFPAEGVLLQTFQSRHFPKVQYQVKLKDGDMVCTCRGFQFHGNCKHVQYMKERVNKGTIVI